MSALLCRLAVLWGAVLIAVCADSPGISFACGGVAMFAVMQRGTAQ